MLVIQASPFKNVLWFTVGAALCIFVGKTLIFDKTRIQDSQNPTLFLDAARPNLAPAKEHRALRATGKNHRQLWGLQQPLEIFMDPKTVNDRNFESPLVDGATSSTMVDDRHEYVLKTVSRKYLDTLSREVHVLKLLSQFPWAPQLLWHDSSSMITSYAGEHLDLFNIPLNYREQYAKILSDIESVGVVHGDIYKPCAEYSTKGGCEHALTLLGPERAESYDLLVLKGKDGENPHMSLVDFGWATVYGSYSFYRSPWKEPPPIYVQQDDREVLNKLDATFQRHLLVEQHLMVDWKLTYSEEEIHNWIKNWPNLILRKLEQHPAYDDDEERVRTFSKFYNMDVDDYRGRTAFNMYHIYDVEPKYDLRPSSKGERLVNVAMFDFKKSLRQAMGGGFFIHATDNIQETKDNMKALELQDEYQQRRFETLKQVFDVLNISGVKYVVMRNFEKMPDKVMVDPRHTDVDLLVDDYYAAKRVLDGDSPELMWGVSYENGYYRIANTVSIGGKGINFDIRHVGDNYLDKQWQQDILERSVVFHSGIRVPSEEDHLYSLIYHAIIQKPKISKSYVEVMAALGNFPHSKAKDKTFLREKLDSFMDRYGYKMVQPQDETVGYYTSFG